MMLSILKKSRLLVLVLALTVAPALAADPDEPTRGNVPTAEEIREREIQLLRRQVAELKHKVEQSEIPRLVYQTQVEVAAIRGFEIDHPVEFAPLTEKALDHILFDTVERSFPGSALELHTWLCQQFGALPEGTDLLALYRDLMGEQAAGLYDPESGKLFVREDFPMAQTMGRMVLAHEICHALQDQQYGLRDMGVEDPADADRAMATLSLAEGDATLLMGEHMALYGKPLGLLSDLPNMLMMNQQELNNAPRAIQRELLFPYLEGMQFFQELDGKLPEGTDPSAAAAQEGEGRIERSVRAGQEAAEKMRKDAGERELTAEEQEAAAEAVAEASRQVARDMAQWRDRVWQDPPVTTEMILHPEKYLARELPVEIEPLGPEDDEHSLETVVGEFGMTLLLEAALGLQRADAAAAGWNGDRLRVTQELDEAGQPLLRRIRWVTHWDTEADADEFRQALMDTFSARIEELAWSEEGSDRLGRAPAADLRLKRPGDTTVELDGLFRMQEPAGEQDDPEVASSR